jgi:Cytosine/adenosine deaminases
MRIALQQAQLAADADEVPVGAVLVIKDRIIAKTYNQTELLQDVTAHAEILALTAGFQFLGTKYLPDATLYVTLEPCVMCAGAIFWSKTGTLVYGASDEKNGFTTITNKTILHPKTAIISGVQKNACEDVMKQFFLNKRKK